MFIHIHNHDSWLPEHMTHGGALVVEDFTGDVASPRDYVIYWYEIWSNTLIGCEPPFSTHAARTIRKIDRCVHWKLYLRSRARAREHRECQRKPRLFRLSLAFSLFFSGALLESDDRVLSRIPLPFPRFIPKLITYTPDVVDKQK